MIRPLQVEDTLAALELVNSTGMFSHEERQMIEARIREHFVGAADSLWLTYDDQGLRGIVYCLAEPMTQGTWNMLMLLVRKASQGQGVGSALVQEAQKLLTAQEARLLIVETSGTDDFEGAKKFYGKCGFTEVARIPDFYNAQDDKVIFTKSL